MGNKATPLFSSTRWATSRLRVIDAAFFEIDEDSGELTMPSSANYENPEDADANNVYEVEVTATNGEGGDSRLVCVAIRDEW